MVLLSRFRTKGDSSAVRKVGQELQPDMIAEWMAEPIKGMPDMIEKTDLVFFKLGMFCENNHVDLMIQYPCTSIVF